MLYVRHELSYTPECKIWHNMKGRCYDQNFASYDNVGGRGIIMCDSWRNDFINFYNDMGPRPSNKHKIDRINNEGNFEKNNCRWALRIVHHRNRIHCKWWFVNGIRYESRPHAAESLGVSNPTIKTWCDGKIVKGRFHPPKENCWSERKYK